MSNLKNKAKKSKLSIKNISTKNEKIINKKIAKIYPKIFYLTSESINLLDETVKRLDEISPKHISNARLIRAAILIISKMETDDLFAAIKQIWY